MLSQVAVDVSSRFRFICNRNLLSVHAPHLSAFQALDLPSFNLLIKTKERKKRDSNHLLCSQTNLKGTTLLSDSVIAQKSRDSLLLIGARVHE